MKVVVYGTPNCMQCKFTRAVLDKMELMYEYIDITIDNDAADDVRTMGYQVLPVVIAGSEQWCGFKLEKLRGLRK